MADDEFPCILTRDQVRFELWLGSKDLHRSTVRDWLGRNRGKAQQAHDALALQMLERFDGFQIRAPAASE